MTRLFIAKVKLIQNLNVTVVEQTVEHLHLYDLAMQTFAVGLEDQNYKNRAHRAKQRTAYIGRT